MDETYKGGVEEAIRKSVVEVALAYHLVSRYTSLVAVDVTTARPTDRLAADPDQTMKVASTPDQSLAELPKTATNGQLHILMGLAAVSLAGLLWGLRRRMA